MPGPLPKADERRQRGDKDRPELELITRDDFPEPAAEWTTPVVDMWDSVWQSAQAAGWTDEQVGLVYLWAESLNRYVLWMREVDETPLVENRFGVEVENPLSKMANKEWSKVMDLGRDLGIPLKAKIGLGLRVSKVEDRSLNRLAEKASKAPADPR